MLAWTQDADRVVRTKIVVIWRIRVVSALGRFGQVVSAWVVSAKCGGGS